MPNPVRFERTTAGLRDALFAEMEDLKAGIATPQEAASFAKLSHQILGTFMLDLEATRLAMAADVPKQIEQSAADSEERCHG